MSDMKPRLVGGFGEINFGKQYRQGNRIYDADAIAVCLTAQPLGNMGGYSSLYVVRRKYAIGYIVVKNFPSGRNNRRK